MPSLLSARRHWLEFRLADLRSLRGRETDANRAACYDSIIEQHEKELESCTCRESNTLSARTAGSCQ